MVNKIVIGTYLKKNTQQNMCTFLAHDTIILHKVYFVKDNNEV